jgi:hypothetical protein
MLVACLPVGCIGTHGQASTESTGVPVSPKAEDPLDSPEWQALRGVWETDEQARPWVRVYFGEPVRKGTFLATLPPADSFSHIHVVKTNERGKPDGLLFEALDHFKFDKGEKGKRIEIDPIDIPVSGSVLSYRLEGEELTLVVEGGDLRGEHRLRRNRDVKPPFEGPDK